MNRSTWTWILLISGALLISCCSTHQLVYAYTQNEAEELIEAAEEAAIDTFMILSEAERAGADTAPILLELNSAADRLNEAKINLNEGASEEAIEEIEATMALINELSSEALQLKTSATVEQENIQRSKILYSSLKIALFIALMYGIRFYSKSFQGKRVMDLKPETL